MIRKQIVFRGRVQGVGFRYTTKKASARFEVCGWVRNLSDGTVEVLAEGAQSEVDRFVQAIIESISVAGFGRVESYESSSVLNATGEYSSFEIQT